MLQTLQLKSEKIEKNLRLTFNIIAKALITEVVCYTAILFPPYVFMLWCKGGAILIWSLLSSWVVHTRFGSSCCFQLTFFPPSKFFQRMAKKFTFDVLLK